MKDGEHLQVTKAVSRAGKVTGQYKHWYNIEYIEMDSKFGEVSSLDLSKTRGLSVVSNTDVIEHGQGLDSNDNSEEILIADVSFDKAKETRDRELDKEWCVHCSKR